MSIDLDLDLDLVDEVKPIFVSKGLRGWIQSLADRQFKNKQRAAVTLMLVVVSLVAIGWNVSRLTILDQLAKLEAQEFRLADQLEDLEFRLQTIDLKRLSTEIDQENHRVFEGFPNLSAWAEELSMQADNYGLTFSYSVGKPHLSPVPNVLEVPMVLRLQANQQQRALAFTNSTFFVESILRDRWHVDILATEAIGDAGGLASMSVDAQVWVRDRFGFHEIEVPQGSAQPATTLVAGE